MRQTYSLENNFLRVSIGALGAELLSLRGSDGLEQMWEGNADIWGRRGPVIFPVLGGWPEGFYRYRGKPYFMDKNGFARSSMFDPVVIQREKVELQLRETRHSREQYPFDFLLKICYYLDSTKLVVLQSVRNESQDEMPTALGLHPGFRWNRRADTSFLRFSSPQTRQAFHPDGIRYSFLREEREIKLTDQLFFRGAISLEHPQAQWVELFQTKRKTSIRIYPEDYSYLTLWSPNRPDANFLCIEPSTSAGTDGSRLEDRRGICFLKPGQTMRRKMMIELVPSEGDE